jgi:3-hydroxyacyl-CoA dehydrogenase
MTEQPVRTERRGEALVITIDNPPVNVVSRAVRAGLLAAVAEAEAALATGAISRVVLTGAGRAFVAGADAREFDLPPMEPHLPDVLLRLMALPVVAAINGVALGGGLEIALACRARVAHPSAQLGLPEVTLGVVPGAGGTQRLPRLAGLASAVSLISEGRLVRAAEARSLGIVDAVEDDVVGAALTLDATLLARPAVDDLPPPAVDADAVAKARSQASSRMRGQIAPQRAIDLVEASARVPLQEGLAQERATFLELRKGEQAAALRHVFFAERGAGAPKDLASLSPATLRTALVIGGGTMGAAIAYALSGVGLHVTLLENDEAAAGRARANVAGLFAEAVKRGKSDAATAEKAQAEGFAFLHGPETPLPPVDIAIEAVFEDLAVKRAVFARLGAVLPVSTLVATNTSYLDVDAIAEGFPEPSRFLGLHFFAPAHVMKLLEVIRARETSQQTLATAFALARKLGKIAVEAGVCDGFIGNRILTRYRQTTDILLIEGATPAAVDTALEQFGMAMGPYAVQDLSGLDIAYANRKRKNLKDKPGIRYVTIADRMVEDLKRLGRKSNAGWYDYEGGVRRPSADVVALVERASADTGIDRRPFDAEEIARRAMLAMMAEAFDILAEGIARRPSDIDLVMVHGYGFPRWRGGPMHLADRWGLAAVRDDLARLAKEDPLSWRVPALLDDLVAKGAKLASLN